MFSPAYVDTFKITTLKESTCSLLLRGRGAQPECQRIYFKHPLSLISLCLSLVASPRFLTLVGSDSLQPRGLCPSGFSALAILQQEYRRACWGLLQGGLPDPGVQSASLQWPALAVGPLPLVPPGNCHLSHSYPLANWAWASRGRGWILDRGPLILTRGLSRGEKVQLHQPAWTPGQHQPRSPSSPEGPWSRMTGEGCVPTSVLSTLFENRAKLLLQYRLCHLNDDARWGQLLTHRIYTKSHPVIFNFLRKAMVSNT